MPTATAAHGIPTIQWYDGNNNKWVDWAEPNVPVNAGSYYVKATVAADPNGQYEAAEAQTTITIAKAQSPVTLVGAGDLVYNKSAQTLATIFMNGSTETVTATINGEAADISSLKGTDAGKYLVAYQTSGDANYEPASGSVEVTIAKAKARVTSAPKSEENLPYTGEFLELLSIAAQVEGGKAVYSLDGTNWTADFPTASEPGKYTVYYKATGDNNYEESAVGSVTSSIIKGTAAFVSGKEPVPTNPEYNGKAQELVTPGTATNGTVKYRLSQSDEFRTDIPKKTDAGSYTVFYKIFGNDGYADSDEGSVVSTIGQKEIRVIIDNKVKAIGEKDPEFTYSVIGLIDAADNQVTGTLSREPGEKAAKYTITGNFNNSNKNYKFAANDPVTNGILTILTDGNMIELNAQGWTYGEQAIMPNATAAHGIPKIYWYDNSKSDWVEWAAPTVPVNAGTYYVKATVAADPNGQYEEAEVQKTITIAKAPSPVTLEGAGNLVYTGAEQTIATLFMNGSTEDVTVTINGEVESNIGSLKRKDVGTYTVAFKTTPPVSGPDNYLPGSGSVVVTIGKAKAKVTTPAKGIDLTYNGNMQTLVSQEAQTDASMGVIVYSLDQKEWLAEPPKAAAVGTYNVYFKVRGNETFDDSEIGKVVSTIKPREPVPTITAATGLTYNASPQRLVTSATCEGGTIKFRLAEGDEYSTNFPTGIDAGTYTVYYIIEGHEGYADKKETSFTVTIAPRAVDISIENKVKAYGQPDPEFTYRVTSQLFGKDDDDVVEPVRLYRENGEEAKMYRIDGNFQIIDPNFTLGTITSGWLTIGTADNSITLSTSDWIYGEYDHNKHMPRATSAFGEPKIEFIDSNGNWREWTATNHPVEVGSYDVRATVAASADNNYTAATATAVVTVSKAQARVVLGRREAVYRTPGIPGTLTFDSKFGDKIYYVKNGETKEDGILELLGKEITISDVKTTATSTSPVGEYPITLTATSKNYDVVVEEGTFEIVPATLAFTVKDNIDVVFDGYDHSIEVKVFDPRNGITIDPSDYKIYYRLGEEITTENFDAKELNEHLVLPREAGNHKIYFYIDSTNYKPERGSGNVNISRAILRVEVKSKEVTYGDLVRLDYKSDLVEFKAYKDDAETKSTEFIEEAVKGLDDFALEAVMVNEDHSKTKYYGQYSPAGLYTVKPVERLESKDYIIKYSTGELKINPKPVRFTWNVEKGHEYIYDGQPHGATASVVKDDLVEEDKNDGQVIVKYSNANSATDVKRNNSTWAVEDYKVTIYGLDGVKGNNYTLSGLTDANATWTYRIIPAEAVMTPNEVTTQYGDAAEDEGYTISGLVEKDKNKNVVYGVPTYKFLNSKGKAYKAGDDVGTYRVAFDETNKFNTLSGPHAVNYTLIPAEGTMNVVKRQIKLVWSANANGKGSFEYDGKKHTVKVSKVINNYDGDKALEYAPTYKNNSKVNAGNYTATVKLNPVEAKNYEIVDGTDSFKWKITKRKVTIQAKDSTIAYGQKPKGNGYVVKNKKLVVNSRTGKLDKIGTVTYKYSYNKNGKPGTYTITPVVSNLNKNYTVTSFNKGKLKVTNAVSILLAAGKASAQNGMRIYWNKVSGAESYDIYFSHCNTDKEVFIPQYIGTTKKASLRVGGLKKNNCYKFYVKAKDKKGKVIAVSNEAHAATGNTDGKYTNAESIKVKKNSVKVKVGRSVTVSASLTKVFNNKELLDQGHSGLFRYLSSNEKVATVTDSGEITGISKGWCIVYVQSVNGLWDSIDVTVK
jgi:hypothetical protein